MEKDAYSASKHILTETGAALGVTYLFIPSALIPSENKFMCRRTASEACFDA